MTRVATTRSLRSWGRVLSACLGGTLLLGVGGAIAAPGASAAGVDVDRFFQGALTGTPTKEDCTLSGGTKTQCYRITVAGFPTSHGVGPFCPSKITDGADAGGLWFDGSALYDLDGPFIKGLAQTYNDSKWKMYDDEGNVIVTDTAAKFEGAARPDVDPSLQNHCVQGKLEWLPNGKPISSTVLIPVAPVLASAPASTRGNLGVTLDGVVIAASAPVDAILGAYTIAAFDDCGAHFNPIEGYHLHGAVGCSERAATTGTETPQFGYAMDGVPVHSPLASTAALDGCNGHTTAQDGYHYHAQNAAKNLVIKCMVGQTVATAQGAPGGGPPTQAGDALSATKLEVARAGVLRSKRQLSVLAPITSRASGSVAATFRAAGTSTSFSAPVDSTNRRVLIKRSIPAAQARQGHRDPHPGLPRRHRHPAAGGPPPCGGGEGEPGGDASDDQ